MKRTMCAALAICMLCFAAACQKDVLPKPTYPLEAQVVTDALAKTGLPGAISETETNSYIENSIEHVIRHPTEPASDTVSLEEAQAEPAARIFYEAVGSGVFDGQRELSVLFSKNGAPEQFLWEDWKQQLAFVALLYGGFESEEILYQTLIKKELPTGEENFVFDFDVPGGYCRVEKSSRRDSAIFNEYGVPAGKRNDVRLRVRIFETRELYRKRLEQSKQAVAKG